ncbi:UNVERIFIED_CONTAM: hypothetical protein HDU68_003676 [Siphonaria sp. JEL0065]|nr:hypothetical protein HDU68_003676 [Siphonaria sp. JEL0065]
MNSKTLFATDDPDFVSFQYGAPGKDLMPSDVMAAASASFWNDIDVNYTYLQYGPTLGDAEFLTELQSFLSKFHATPVRQECLAITSGASQSFSNIITLFTTHKTRIIIENPTYFLALKVLEDHGFNANEFINVPTDHDGLDVEYFETLLEREAEGGLVGGQAEPHKYSYLLYLVPTYSNPSGRSTSLARREKIVQLARKFDVLVVCDDVYNLLPLSSQQPPERLVALDLKKSFASSPGEREFGNVVSNNSFSKILAPGMRLGWIEASPYMLNFLSKSGIMNSGGSPNHIVSGLVLSAMSLGGLESHIAMLKKVYAERMHAMCDYLEVNLPQGVVFDRPEGGFFIWVRLPEGHDAFEIQQANQKGLLYRGKKLAAVKMSYAPGRLFTVDPKASGNCLRLTFAFFGKEKLLEGCERLCALLKEALA